MRHEAEIRRRGLVAEGGNRRRQLHQSGNRAASDVAECTVGVHHHALALTHHTHVYVHTRTCLAGGDFRGKRHGEPAALRFLANNPLGKHQLVGCVLGINRKEFYFVLLVEMSVVGECAHFAMPIFDFAACLGNIRHALLTEIAKLGKRSRLVVATLVGSGERAIIGRYNIIFQLAHALKFHAGDLVECTACAVQSLYGCCIKRLTVLVEIGAKQSERRNLAEWVDKCRLEAR